VGALVVDWSARTITGPAIPYDRTAFIGGRHYQFAEHWARHDVVPLLHEHDNARRAGRAIALTDTPAALCVVLKVSPGRLGDGLLERTHAGALGLSPKFVPDPGGLAHMPGRPGALLVISAWLVELSLTVKPAFGLR
jgi:hypothetical protein